MRGVVFISHLAANDRLYGPLHDEYSEKINFLVPFAPIRLKSYSAAREQKLRKVTVDSETLLKQIKEDDFVILCDEMGRDLNSLTFSKKVVELLENNRRLVFCIGGPYGVNSSVKERADFVLKLSTLTLNHCVAQIVLLEQIYRALMIWKGRSYHNE